MTVIGRRALLLSVGGLAIVAVRATILGRRVIEDEQRRRAAEVDYLAGRVTMVNGWIVSESEALRSSRQE